MLAAWWISVQFFLILNDRVAWWYPVVNLALLIPLYLAASFWVVWFAKDQVSSRVQLQAAVILTIISVSLYAAWTIIYFVWIYKGNTVYYGWGTREAGYLKFQKKYYIFKELLNAAILLVIGEKQIKTAASSLNLTAINTGGETNSVDWKETET